MMKIYMSRKEKIKWDHTIDCFGKVLTFIKNVIITCLVCGGALLVMSIDSIFEQLPI